MSCVFLFKERKDIIFVALVRSSLTFVSLKPVFKNDPNGKKKAETTSYGSPFFL